MDGLNGEAWVVLLFLIQTLGILVVGALIIFMIVFLVSILDKILNAIFPRN